MRFHSSFFIAKFHFFILTIFNSITEGDSIIELVTEDVWWEIVSFLSLISREKGVVTDMDFHYKYSRMLRNYS